MTPYEKQIKTLSQLLEGKTMTATNFTENDQTMTELFTPAELADIVDTLATIRAHIADETMRADTYRDCLIAAKVDAVDGTLHRATITSTAPVKINWENIARALSTDPKKLDRLIKKHTEAQAPRYTVRITARKVAR